jgi:hypothetical protein
MACPTSRVRSDREGGDIRRFGPAMRPMGLWRWARSAGSGIGELWLSWMRYRHRLWIYSISWLVVCV